MRSTTKQFINNKYKWRLVAVNFFMDPLPWHSMYNNNIFLSWLGNPNEWEKINDKLPKINRICCSWLSSLATFLRKYSSICCSSNCYIFLVWKSKYPKILLLKCWHWMSLITVAHRKWFLFYEFITFVMHK